MQVVVHALTKKIGRVQPLFHSVKLIALIVSAGLFLSGCSYKQAEEKGRETFPEVQKFDRLIEKTKHEITYRHGVGGHTVWQGIGALYGRYFIYIGFDVKVGPSHTPMKTSEAIIQVSEYGTVSAKSKVLLGSLSEEQWDWVETVDDIFTLLKHTPIKDKPEEFIEDALRF